MPNKPFINDQESEREAQAGVSADILADLLHGPTPISLDESLLRRKRKKKKRNPFISGSSPHLEYYLQPVSKKKRVETKVLVPVNEKIIEQANRNRKRFVRRMGKNMDQIRSFLAYDLGSKMLPTISAIEEARDLLKEITGEEVRSSIYGMLLKLLQTGAEIKITTFITKYLRLTKREEEDLLSTITSNKAHEKDLSNLQKLYSMSRPSEGLHELLMREIRGIQKALTSIQKRGGG